MPDERDEPEQMKRLDKIGELFQKGWAKTHPIPEQHRAMIEQFFSKPLEERVKDREKEAKEEIARQKQEQEKQQSQKKKQGPSHGH